MPIDYGKIAYLKTCDMENQLRFDRSAAKKRQSSESLILTGLAAVSNFKSDSLELECEENSNANIRFGAEITVSKNHTAKVFAMLSGQILEQFDYSFEAGRNSLNFEVNVQNFVNKENEIYLKIDCGENIVYNIHFLQIFANGQNFNAAELPFCKLIKLSGYTLIFLENGKNIDVYRQYEGQPMFLEKFNTFEKFFKKADFAIMMSGNLERLTCYYINENDELFLREFTYTNGNLTTPRKLLDNVEYISACTIPTGQSICYLYKNKVLQRSIRFENNTYLLTASSHIYFFTAKTADLKIFYCGGNQMIFAVSEQGGIFIRTGEDEPKKIGEGQTALAFENEGVLEIYYLDGENIYLTKIENGAAIKACGVAAADMILTDNKQLFLQKGKRIIKAALQN